VPDEEGNLVPTNQVAVLRGTGDDTTVSVHDVLSEPRADATVTALPGGRVLVAGGVNEKGEPLATADLLDVGDDGVPNLLAVVDLARPRAGHVAAMLPTGDLLLAGGRTEGGELTGSLELYTPRPE
jgi:hypothetical protein